MSMEYYYMGQSHDRPQIPPLTTRCIQDAMSSTDSAHILATKDLKELYEGTKTVPLSKAIQKKKWR